MGYERLSGQDTLFLHIEDAEQPQHVGALAVFEAAPLRDADGRFRIEELRRHVAARLHLVPRFRKRLMEVPLQQGRPIWVDDPTFDLEYHLRLTALPTPGDEDLLLALMGRLQSQLLDRGRPLWELWFVEGLAGDRVAMIQKTHHCLVDGISGVDVATVLLDFEPEPPAPADPPPWQPEPAPSPAQLLMDSLVERATEPAELVRSARAALRTPARLLDQLGGIGRAAGELAHSAPDMPWNVPCGRHRRFCPARVPLERVRAIRAAGPGVTVNDVVLASVAGALRRFLTQRAIPVDGLVLRAMVPVSVRGGDERMALGNRVSTVVVELPVGEADPRRRLLLISDGMRHVKESGMALAADAILRLQDFAPPTLLGIAGRLAVRSRAVNLVVTNVPGPQVPLYCMGARLLEAFPYVGVVQGKALGVAVVSYDGWLGFGVTGDRDVMADLHVVAEGIEESVDELGEALGV
jgi:WS/DGAT/MGAT family acyltransferase